MKAMVKRLNISAYSSIPLNLWRKLIRRRPPRRQEPIRLSGNLPDPSFMLIPPDVTEGNLKDVIGTSLSNPGAIKSVAKYPILAKNRVGKSGTTLGGHPIVRSLPGAGKIHRAGQAARAGVTTSESRIRGNEERMIVDEVEHLEAKKMHIGRQERKQRPRRALVRLFQLRPLIISVPQPRPPVHTHCI